MGRVYRYIPDIIILAVFLSTYYLNIIIARDVVNYLMTFFLVIFIAGMFVIAINYNDISRAMESYLTTKYMLHTFNSILFFIVMSVIYMSLLEKQVFIFGFDVKLIISSILFGVSVENGFKIISLLQAIFKRSEE